MEGMLMNGMNFSLLFVWTHQAAMVQRPGAESLPCRIRRSEEKGCWIHMFISFVWIQLRRDRLDADACV